jgi:hypothetical protein
MSNHILHNTLKVDKLLKQQIDALKRKSVLLKTKAQNLANLKQQQNIQHKNIPNRHAYIPATHVQKHTQPNTNANVSAFEPVPAIELLITELQEQEPNTDATTIKSNQKSSDNASKNVQIHGSIYLDKNVIIM